MEWESWVVKDYEYLCLFVDRVAELPQNSGWKHNYSECCYLHSWLLAKASGMVICYVKCKILRYVAEMKNDWEPVTGGPLKNW